MGKLQGQMKAQTEASAKQSKDNSAILVIGGKLSPENRMVQETLGIIVQENTNI